MPSKYVISFNPCKRPLRWYFYPSFRDGEIVSDIVTFPQFHCQDEWNSNFSSEPDLLTTRLDYLFQKVLEAIKVWT